MLLVNTNRENLHMAKPPTNNHHHKITTENFKMFHTHTHLSCDIIVFICTSDVFLYFSLDVFTTCEKSLIYFTIYYLKNLNWQEYTLRTCVGNTSSCVNVGFGIYLNCKKWCFGDWFHDWGWSLVFGVLCHVAVVVVANPLGLCGLKDVFLGAVVVACV